MKDIRVRRLLALSFLLAVGRALIAPLLALSLGRQLGLPASGVGLLLGGVLLASTLSSLYLGYLADRCNRRHLLSLALLLLAGGFVAIAASGLWWQAALGLALTEGAYALFGITAKAVLSDVVPPAQRGRVFSLRYSLVNIGYAFGPCIGSLLAAERPAWAFWLASALALSCLPLVRGLPARAQGAAASPVSFAATLSVLGRDRVLRCFLLGSLLACMVHGRFADYLSMYLMQAHGDAEVLRRMSWLIGCNAVVVVTLQYPLGRLLRTDALVRWIALASALLAASMLGFAASDSLWGWVGWMAVFTLGEILIIPAEYLFVDALAPEALKGSYYGAHNLSFLGSALGPLLAGGMLGAFPAPALLWLMAAGSLAGAALVCLAARQPAASCRTEVAGAPAGPC